MKNLQKAAGVAAIFEALDANNCVASQTTERLQTQKNDFNVGLPHIRENAQVAHY